MNPRQLYQWVKRTSKTWTGVTRHFQATVSVFSRGVVRAQSSQVRTIAGCVEGNRDSQRRRLQRFVSQPTPLATFVAGWTRSLVAALHPSELVLVVDETKLKDQWAVMVVGVAYAGRCIPLAWRVYRANRRTDYPAEGQVELVLGLLRQVKAGVPASLKVRILADRGIGTSPGLLWGIMELGWTFLVRVTKQSKIVLPDGQAVTFYDQVNGPGDAYSASGEVFKQRGRVPAHVRVLWGKQAQARWALVTNDPALTGWEYAQRMWIEEAFRDLKSHGWQVEQVALPTAERIERLWIILVVAYAWMLLWGGVLAALEQTARLKRRSDGSYVRRWSLFREGRQAFLAATPPG